MKNLITITNGVKHATGTIAIRQSQLARLIDECHQNGEPAPKRVLVASALLEQALEALRDASTNLDEETIVDLVEMANSEF
jgi:hypothetical protein